MTRPRIEEVEHLAVGAGPADDGGAASSLSSWAVRSGPTDRLDHRVLAGSPFLRLLVELITTFLAAPTP